MSMYQRLNSIRMLENSLKAGVYGAYDYVHEHVLKA